MAIEVKKLKREFSYNGMSLMDPGLTFSPEQVRDVYSAQYPELTTAAVDGPEQKGDVAHYTFVRAAGAKGAYAQV